jgi:hypothetical protein
LVTNLSGIKDILGKPTMMGIVAYFNSEKYDHHPTYADLSAKEFL